MLEITDKFKNPIFKKISFCLFDWANSPFSTVVITFVFAAYFQKAIVGDVVKATTLWGWAIGISGFLVAVSAPTLGVIADSSKNIRPWFITTTLCVSLCSALLWFVRPEESFIIPFLIIIVIANFSFELGMVFYNSRLTNISSLDSIGKLSGIAWATGYFGGIICLGIVLFGFIKPENPILGISTLDAENVRIAGPIVAIWFLIFSWPLIVSLEPNNASNSKSLRESLSASLKKFKNLFQEFSPGRFLLARMIYTDGLNTLFAFGGLYAAGTFGMKIEEVIIFGISLNLTAGIGALLFGFIDDKVGPKKVILVSLFFLMILGTLILLIKSIFWFWILGLMLGLFIGPVQSSSRTLMAHISNPKEIASSFGLFALSGKATAFLGPVVLAIVSDVFQSQRAGMFSIVVFMLVGFVILVFTKNINV